MRLTLNLYGHTLDLTIGPTEPDTEPCCSLDGGTTTAYPIGFTPQAAEPAMWIPPDRTLPWDEPEDTA